MQCRAQSRFFTEGQPKDRITSRHDPGALCSHACDASLLSIDPFLFSHVRTCLLRRAEVTTGLPLRRAIAHGRCVCAGMALARGVSTGAHLRCINPPSDGTNPQNPVSLK